MTVNIPNECGLCERIERTIKGNNPSAVAEMESGFVVLGDYQYFRGYSLLLYKEHFTELHQLTRTEKMLFLEEMSILAEAVNEIFTPVKINYELLGNSLAHMHWHIFPRLKDDPIPNAPVWLVDKSIRYAESARPSADELFILKSQLLDKLKQIAPERIRKSFV